MAHLIDMSNDRANMAYVGETPWHRLGTQLDPDSTIDEWKIAAGLDWTIEKRPIAYGITNDAGEITPQLIDGRFAHVRSDTQACIGMGSDRFNLIQPGDVLEFYRDLVEGSRFRIETAGSLKGGAKIWALARYDQDLIIGDSASRDRLQMYILLATANDGTMSTIAKETSTRVVCNNTLSIAVGNNEGRKTITVPHSRQFDADAVKAELGLYGDHLATFARDADQLAETRISDEQAIEFFVNLIAKTNDKGEVTNNRNVDSTVKKLIRLYRRGPGADMPTADGTAWGAVNAVTRHVDFETKARNQENRFNAGQFGIGAQLKQRAFADALKIAA